MPDSHASVTTFDPESFLDAARTAPVAASVSMRAALLVGPEGYEVSAESAVDNAYVAVGERADLNLAHDQHARLQAQLEQLGVPVLRFDGLSGQCDGVFVNNAFATSRDTLVIGSMFHPGRKAEPGRQDLRRGLVERFGYRVCDLSGQDCVAELTGSLVIDRLRNVGFCGLSQRADRSGMAAMHEAFGLRATLGFELHPAEYHTNMVLAIFAGRACVVHEPGVGARVVSVLETLYDGQVLRLTDEEKNACAGNCLCVTDRHVMLSSRARAALSQESARRLSSWGFELIDVDVSEFEKAGGSLRCLISELY